MAKVIFKGTDYRTTIQHYLSLPPHRLGCVQVKYYDATQTFDHEGYFMPSIYFTPDPAAQVATGSSSNPGSTPKTEKSKQRAIISVDGGPLASKVASNVSQVHLVIYQTFASEPRELIKDNNMFDQWKTLRGRYGNGTFECYDEL